MHFCADSSGVLKTRTVSWDPSGRVELRLIRIALYFLFSQSNLQDFPSEGAQASEPNLAQDDVPASELQTDRDDDSGDLTAGAASSGVRRPLENPDEGIFGSPRPPRRSVLQSKLKSNKVARPSVCRHLRTLNLLTNG